MEARKRVKFVNDFYVRSSKIRLNESFVHGVNLQKNKKIWKKWCITILMSPQHHINVHISMLMKNQYWIWGIWKGEGSFASHQFDWLIRIFHLLCWISLYFSSISTILWGISLFMANLFLFLWYVIALKSAQMHILFRKIVSWLN